MNVYERKFEQVLKKVQKPARYIGNEFNSVHKESFEKFVKFAFCFPDVYEVGMSHLGMKILYHMMNERTDTVCERVFAPWVDMEKELRKADIPLLSLESHMPVSSFDIVGFTLQYEMSYSNILNMLDLAKIPLKSKDRDENTPFVCAGGPCAYNGEPLAEIVDFFILGEGEEVNNEIIDEFKEWKASGETRISYLERISKIEGVYVPAFYDVKYKNDN